MLNFFKLALVAGVLTVIGVSIDNFIDNLREQPAVCYGREERTYWGPLEDSFDRKKTSAQRVHAVNALPKVHGVFPVFILDVEKTRIGYVAEAVIENTYETIRVNIPKKSIAMSLKKQDRILISGVVVVNVNTDGFSAAADVENAKYIMRIPSDATCSNINWKG